MKMPNHMEEDIVTPQEASWLLGWSVREVLISGIPKIKSLGNIHYYRRDILRAMGVEEDPDYPTS